MNVEATEPTTPAAAAPTPAIAAPCCALDDITQRRLHNLVIINDELRGDVAALSVGCAFLLGMLFARYL